jgi:hypothetical protein
MPHVSTSIPREKNLLRSPVHHFSRNRQQQLRGQTLFPMMTGCCLCQAANQACAAGCNATAQEIRECLTRTRQERIHEGTATTECWLRHILTNPGCMHAVLFAIYGP